MRVIFSRAGVLGVVFVLGLLHWFLLIRAGNPTYTAFDWPLIHQWLDVIREGLRTGEVPYHASFYLREFETGAYVFGDRFFAIPFFMASPQVLLLRFMSVPSFMTVQLLLMYSLGFAGIVAWVRRFNLSAASAALLAVLWSFNGFFVGRLGVGHLQNAAYLLIPWFFWLLLAFIDPEFLQGTRRRRLFLSLLLALFLQFVLLQGSLLTLAQFFLVAGIVLLFYPRRLPWYALTVFVALLLGSYLFVPNFLYGDYGRDLGRVVFGGYGTTSGDAGVPLLASRSVFAIPVNVAWHLWEGLTRSFTAATDASWVFSVYISVWGVALVLIGLFGAYERYRPRLRDFFKPSLRFVFPAMIVTVLSLSSVAHHLFALLQHIVVVPAVDRLPSRLFIYPLSLLFLFASTGFDAAARRFPARLRLPFQWGAVLVLLVVFFWHSAGWSVANGERLFVRPAGESRHQFKTVIYQRTGDEAYRQTVRFSFLASAVLTAGVLLLVLWLRRPRHVPGSKRSVPQSVIDWSTVSAVIFDVDGTLYDQQKLRRFMLRELAWFYALRFWRLYDLKVLFDFRRTREQSAVEGIENMAEAQYELTSRVSHVSKERVRRVVGEWMLRRPLQHLPECRERSVFDFFAVLNRKGISIAFCSDYPATEKLLALGFPESVTVVSTDVGSGRLKPDASALLVAAERLGVSVGECLFIGDRRECDGQAAQRVGMRYLHKDATFSYEGFLGEVGALKAKPVAPSTLQLAKRSAIAKEVLFLDGISGTGKTMMAQVLQSFLRVELGRFDHLHEYLSILDAFGRIEPKTAEFLMRMFADLSLYNAMIGRETNFRPGDLSGVWNNPGTLGYLRRLFQDDGNAVLGRIAKERPILQIVSHEALSVFALTFRVFGRGLRIVEMVRHPLYLLDHWESCLERIAQDPRDFSIWIDADGHGLPWFVQGWEERYRSSSTIDNVIYTIESLTTRVDRFLATLDEQQHNQIYFIPLEQFIVKPAHFIERLESHLGTAATRATQAVLRKRGLPQQQAGGGPAKAIYKRYGWKPPERGASEREILDAMARRVATRASAEALTVLQRLCLNYEQRYGLWF